MVTLSLNGTYDDLPPGIRDAVDRIERSDKDRRRRDQNQSSQPFFETWKGIAALAGIVSMAFTIGYNWHEVTSLRSDYEEHVKLVSDPIRGYMPREVADTRYLEMKRRFDDLQRTLDTISNDIALRPGRRN